MGVPKMAGSNPEKGISPMNLHPESCKFTYSTNFGGTNGQIVCHLREPGASSLVDLQKLKYEPPNTDTDATTRI